jgi:predicted DNA-binding protein (UPF0251 family)
MADYLKVVATNITDGPKIFNSAPPGVLAAGASTDVEVSITPEELESMRFSEWFEISGGDAEQTSKLPGLKGKTKDQLLAIAADEKVEIEDGATVNDIISAIELNRESKA